MSRGVEDDDNNNLKNGVFLWKSFPDYRLSRLFSSVTSGEEVAARMVGWRWPGWSTSLPECFYSDCEGGAKEQIANLALFCILSSTFALSVGRSYCVRWWLLAKVGSFAKDAVGAAVDEKESAWNEFNISDYSSFECKSRDRPAIHANNKNEGKAKSLLKYYRTRRINKIHFNVRNSVCSISCCGSSGASQRRIITFISSTVRNLRTAPVLETQNLTWLLLEQVRNSACGSDIK